MKVIVLSINARQDLLSILDYLASESPAVALRTVYRLEKACLELGDRWQMYRLLPRHEASGVRRRIVGNYGVYYLADDRAVKVLQILHSARDHEHILFPQD